MAVFFLNSRWLVLNGEQLGQEYCRSSAVFGCIVFPLFEAI